MRSARFLPGMVSAQWLSKGQTWLVIGDFVLNKDKWNGIFIAEIKTTGTLGFNRKHLTSIFIGCNLTMFFFN
jgi:hypothetical protein